MQRVAASLVRELDAVVSQGSDARWVLLCPERATAPLLRRIEVRHSGVPGLPLPLWEQLVLPLAARDGVLVSLSGSAPRWAARQACLLHDAAVFDWPQAYRRRFVWWYRALFHRLARSSAQLFTVSVHSRDRLTQALAVAPQRIEVIANGGDHLRDVLPDPEALDRFGLRECQFLLSVASANPSKNLARLLAAWPRLKKPPAMRLLLVGDSNSRVFANEPGQPDPPGVQRVGAVSDAELKALYGQATALVFPSLYEGFGLPPLEAMSCGCPVLASIAPAVLATCGDAASYFDPTSIESMVAALDEVISDAALRQRLRNAGLARAACFAWQDAAQRRHARLLAVQP